jgi:hypothetical protein
MTTMVEGQSVPAVAASSTRRALTPWLGIAYAVLFFFAFFITNTPDDNKSNATWVNWYAKSGHRTELVVSAFLFMLASLCLITFLSEMWSRVTVPNESGQRNPLALAAGGMAAGAIAIGGTLNAIIAGAMVFGNLHEPGPDVLRLSLDMGYPVIAIPGMIALALAMGILTINAGKVGLFGRKLTIFGIVLAVLTVASFLFFPLVAMLVWSIVASVVLVRSKA